MVDSHIISTSGAIWFKHKYLTNPTVTPEDQIVAAIGGLAKMLNAKVPLLDVSGQPNTAANYKKALGARELLTEKLRASRS